MRPSGIYDRNYHQTVAVARTREQKALLIVAIVVLFALPRFVPAHILYILNLIGITIIAVQGLNIVTGYAGQINLGQAAFMAVGAYTSAILTSKLGLSFWVALPCAGIVTALVGILFGLPSLRLKGFYLVMSTLAAQFILIWIILHIPNLTGGIHGLAAPKPRIWGLNFNTHQSFYFIVMFFVVLFTFFAKNLARSKIGRAFVAIRDNDIAADVMGINLTFYKLLAFLICSLYAGVAGALWAHYVGYISVEHFTLMNSIWYLGMLIIGGMGTAVGPIFGAIFLRLAEQFTMWASPMIAETFPLLATTVASGLGQVLFGIVIILFLVFEPRGLAHTWGLFKNYYRLWPFPY